jgi:hypothetical protein
MTENQMRAFGYAYDYCGHFDSDTDMRATSSSLADLKSLLTTKETEVVELKHRIQMQELEQEIAAKQNELEALRK